MENNMKDTIHSPFVPRNGRTIWATKAQISAFELKLYQREFSLPAIEINGEDEMFCGLMPTSRHIGKAVEWLDGAEFEVKQNGFTFLTFQAGFSVWNKRPLLTMELNRVHRDMFFRIGDGTNDAAFQIEMSDVEALREAFANANAQPIHY